MNIKKKIFQAIEKQHLYNYQKINKLKMNFHIKNTKIKKPQKILILLLYYSTKKKIPTCKTITLKITIMNLNHNKNKTINFNIKGNNQSNSMY